MQPCYISLGFLVPHFISLPTTMLYVSLACLEYNKYICTKNNTIHQLRFQCCVFHANLDYKEYISMKSNTTFKTQQCFQNLAGKTWQKEVLVVVGQKRKSNPQLVCYKFNKNKCIKNNTKQQNKFFNNCLRCCFPSCKPLQKEVLVVVGRKRRTNPQLNSGHKALKRDSGWCVQNVCT